MLGAGRGAIHCDQHCLQRLVMVVVVYCIQFYLHFHHFIIVGFDGLFQWVDQCAPSPLDQTIKVLDFFISDGLCISDT